MEKINKEVENSELYSAMTQLKCLMSEPKKSHIEIVFHFIICLFEHHQSI